MLDVVAAQQSRQPSSRSQVVSIRMPVWMTIAVDRHRGTQSRGEFMKSAVLGLIIANQSDARCLGTDQNPQPPATRKGS